MLVVASTSVVLAGLWAQTQSSLDLNLFATLNGLAGNMVGIGQAFYALGSIWAVLIVGAGLFLLHARRAAWHAVLAGAVAWGIAELLNEILGPHSIQGLHV